MIPHRGKKSMRLYAKTRHERKSYLTFDLGRIVGRAPTYAGWVVQRAPAKRRSHISTIAAEYQQRGQLAATFFFWRKTGDRDDIKKLVPTLAYQIAQKIPSAREAMETALNLNDASRAPLLSRDPLSKLSLEDQLSTFLIASDNPSAPNLVVIDGLDECSSQDGICRLIEWIRNKSSFRFLLTSRRERGIEISFSLDPYRRHTNALILSLSESEDDIRRYFVEQLGNLCRKQRWLGLSLWPSELDLEKLVEQSEGLFVYAATAVRHISGKGYPENRLGGVLERHRGLDYLYIQVIEEASEWDYFGIVMGSLLYLRYPLSVNGLSIILHPLHRHLTMSGIHCALEGCHSILAITDDYTAIEPYHASLRDFLTDQQRSQTLFHPPATSHGQLMFACLLAITRAFNDGELAPKYAVVSWYYHSCFFLSAGDGSEGLEELRDGAWELVNKVDLNWIRLWMIEALCWAGVPYLREVKFPTQVRKWYINLNSHHWGHGCKDLVDTYWTCLLKPMLQKINGILEVGLASQSSMVVCWI